METEPQLLHVLAPNEPVVAIGVEVRIAEAAGMMNIAVPSIVIKMMRQKFDQPWPLRKTQACEAEQARLLSAIRQSSLTVEVRLAGLELTVRDLLALSEGHLVSFDRLAGSPVELLVNGWQQYRGQIVSTGKNAPY